MTDNFMPEQPRVGPEKKTNAVRLLYGPETARKNLGKYFISDRVNGIIKGKKIVSEFLDGQDLEENQRRKETKRKFEIGRDLFSEEDLREIQFVELVKEYHEELSRSVEKNEELIKDLKNEFLDPLSIGILYEIHKDEIRSLKPSDLPGLMESDQFKAAKKNTLLALAEESLDRFDDPQNTSEIDSFARYVRNRNGVNGSPTSNQEWKNLFIKHLEDNSEEFLRDYFIGFRFSESAEGLSNSRNAFKLGEMVTGEVVRVGRSSAEKLVAVEEFLPYEDKEHGFFEKRYWGAKMEEQLESQPIKSRLDEALHEKRSDRHRAEEVLLDLGVIKAQESSKKFTVESEFIEIFADYFTKDTENKQGQNQMVLGMLYAMRAELGVGVLPKKEVMKRAEKIIPGLKRVGNDILLKFIGNNPDEYYPELQKLMKDAWDQGLLSEIVIKDAKEIEKDKSLSDKEKFLLLSSRNRAEVMRLIVNNRNIDGFKIGETLGGILKRTAVEKNSEDRENLDKLDVQTKDENAAMTMLIEGKEIKDPKIRERVERTMKKTSRLWKFIQRESTRFKVGLQKILFYSEGESSYMAKPSLKGKLKSVGLALVDTALLGHGVNYVAEEPINRGVQAAFFIADYFLRDEWGAALKEIRTKKKELLERPVRQGHWYKPFSKERKEYRKEIREYKKELKQLLKPFKKEIYKKFWHNKGKLLYSVLSYAVTSGIINYALNKIGLTGPEATAVLMASNLTVSSLLSGVGIRTGAEFIINALSGKKVVDGGMELMTGNKEDIGAGRNRLEEKPKYRLKKRRSGKAVTYIKEKGKKIATNIADRIEKIRYVKKFRAREKEENRRLQMLERFVNGKDKPGEKFTKDELLETIESLNWIKEEQEILMIHNYRFYSKRRIVRPDGSEVYIDNTEGLKNIDKTRGQIVEYAQNNLPKEDYDEVVEGSLDFFADVKNIREKVFNKRMKYLIASYGYRATFMILSRALTASGGLLEKPANAIFGDATMDPQHIIQQAPTTVFHADLETPKGQEALAKEVWARAEELNNLVNLMDTSDQLAEFQPGFESHLAYYGVNQAQIENLINNLRGNVINEHNLNTSDLMRMIYILSSYKEGQEFLAKIPGLDGTERRNLGPFIDYLSKEDPVVFMEKATRVKGASVLLSLKYPDIADKLNIPPQPPLADQVNNLLIPESQKERILAGMSSGNPIVITTVGPQLISVGNLASEFVDGLSKEERQSKIDFLLQMNGIYRTDSSLLQKAVDFHYGSFLADANKYINIDKNPILDENRIKDLPAESVIYKIYIAIDPKTDAEIFRVTDLLNKAKSGDINAYNQLCQLVVGADQADLNKIFDSQVDPSIYEKILDGLPGDEMQRKEEIIRRLQQNMIDLGLRPIPAPILDLEEMTALSQDPEIFADPRQALIRALSPDNSDLEMAVSLTGNTKTVFVENKQVVGYFSRDLQYSISYSDEDRELLRAIEGAESDNNRLTLPTILGRNLSYIFGLRDTASGATPPAGTLIEMMTGPFGHGAINPDAPAALHNYDAYGPGYLVKLVIAHFRGRVPDELLAQMGPNADLTKSIQDKDPSWIDRLCNKLETLIAEKVLVAKYGEDKVLDVYMNHVILGTVNGVELKGVEAASQVLFNEPFEELTLGEKFLILASGQSPGEYLYDSSYDAGGNIILTPNPAKAINHAIYIIEEGKIGIKLDKYLPGGKDQILADLHAMDERVKANGWESVFGGKMQLPEGVENFAATPAAARYMGMTDVQIEEAIKNGEIKGVAFIHDKGVKVIELNDIVIKETSKAIPEGLMTPYELTGEQNIGGQLAVQMGALVTDAKREGNFLVTNSGINIPVVEDINGNAIPGIAVIEIGPDGVMSRFDQTGMLSYGPQLFGSAYKPIEAFLLMRLHPEMNLGEQSLGTGPDYFHGQLITNATAAGDQLGNVTVKGALGNTLNVPMVRLWEIVRAKDPEIWFKYQKLAKEEFGIYFYELKEGKFVEIKDDPFEKNVAMAVGNIFVGGATPEESGMIKMTEAYQRIGEMSVQDDPAAEYVFDALNDPANKSANVWGQSMIDNEFNPQIGNSLIAIKTGSQQGFNPATGEPMAIRNVVASIKIDPDGKVTSTLVETTGLVDGKPVELGWGSDFIPVARNIIGSSGAIITPESAQAALNTLIVTPEAPQNYQLGAVSVDQLYPFLKSLSSEDQYAALREQIRFNQTKYLFVDLVGTAIDGKVQPVAIHFIDKDGVDRLITMNVSSGVIEPAGPLVGHFANTKAQTIIYDILEKAIQAEPEKYGGILNQFKGQGINFVPLHDYESSPALFALHEQMEKNGMLFSGAEDSGAIIKRLELDQKTTVFVNDELFRALYEKNPDVIKEQLFAQREYLAMAEIYEASGSSGSLDTLLYEKDMTSSPAYQLLRIFVETKTSQVFTPVDEERKFLIDQFNKLVSNQKKAGELAPDIIRAYNLYNEMSESIARGVAPTQPQATEFVNLMKNFTSTTNKRTLLSLGIGVNPSVPNSTPLPTGILPEIAPDLSPGAFKANKETIVAVGNLIKDFLEKPEKFDAMSPNERSTASLIMNNATLLLDIVESPEAKNLSGQPLVDYINSHLPDNLKNDGYVQLYINQFSNSGRQCADMSLLINRILELSDPQRFHSIGHVDGSGDTAKSFIGHLMTENPPSGELIENHFLTKFINDVTDVKVGDNVVIAYPWLDGFNGRDDYSHMATVVLKGVENGKPYILVFESDGDNGGITQFRKIFSLNDFVSQRNWDIRAQMYPDPTQAERYKPIFGVVRYIGGQTQAPSP